MGGRALDLLAALIEHAGTVLPKADLIARVWPDVTVEEVGLRVHVANLRKALGDGKDGVRYIVNVAGRGYSFVAPLAAEAHAGPPPVLSHVEIEPERRLPPRPATMVGREDAVQSILHGVRAHRFVTVTGSGGTGKTTVAIAVAHALLEEFLDGVCFVDLAEVSDPALVPGTLVSALGKTIQSSDPLTGALALLRNKRTLLLLDNCEHVIEAAATAAERIFQEAPEACIVATSREPLRAVGERVHGLHSLVCPPKDDHLTVEDVLAYPAARLFVDRAVAADDLFEVEDADVPMLGQICRALDGNAFAIELAASQASVHGVQGLANLLDDRLGLLAYGRRTAPPRHRTLRALMDWSYDLLSAQEQKALCRLSCFNAGFTLDAARAVMTEEGIGPAPVAAILSGLVRKSLLAREVIGNGMRYRLLNTTREYASARLRSDGDPDLVARRHALYVVKLLENENAARRSDRERRLIFTELLGDVRATLEWSYSDRGDASIAKTLCRRAVSLFHELSLLSECKRWAEQALALIPEEEHGAAPEMELLATFAVALMYIKGNSDEVRLAFVRALALAERLKDASYELRLNAGLHTFALRTGDFLGALRHAQRCATLAETVRDAGATRVANAALAVSHHLTGDQAAAWRHCEAVLDAQDLHRRSHIAHFGFDLENRARICQARLLWLRGFPEQAEAVAQASIREAAELEHPVTLCVSLIWTLPVFFWIGSLDAAEENIERFIRHYEKHQFAAYFGVGLGLKGMLAIKQGNLDRGTKLLRESLFEMRTNRYGLVTTPFQITLVEGLAKSGRTEEALVTADREIDRIRECGNLFYMPDFLRVKGDVLAFYRADKGVEAEKILMQSLNWARRQHALSWELKSAISLARLYRAKGRPSQAVALLHPLHRRFTEGFATADLVQARQLLQPS